MTQERITERDLETLNELEAANRNLTEVGFRDGWARPMDCGAFNGSHHSKTLQKLNRLGFVDMSRPARLYRGNARPGIGYKINEAGLVRLKQWKVKRIT